MFDAARLVRRPTGLPPASLPIAQSAWLPHDFFVSQPYIVQPPIRLAKFDSRFCEGRKKKETRSETAKLCQRLNHLQQLFYANADHALLIVLQGMDASGKDGTVRHVLSAVNPAGVDVANFKQPTSNELARDYLWRVHHRVPRYGQIGVFNRSHYEDVLVVRVNTMVPKPVWARRYQQINDFERMLSENRYTILKFFLHISKKEQKERFQSRMDDEHKNWKLSQADMDVRKEWDAYQTAYEDVLNKCSTPHAPWHIIPADRKWFRNYLIARILVETFESFNHSWPKPTEDISKIKIPD